MSKIRFFLKKEEISILIIKHLTTKLVIKSFIKILSNPTSILSSKEIISQSSCMVRLALERPIL